MIANMKVGDTLKTVLSNTWHIPTCGACHETAARMNDLGVAGCRAKVDALAEQLHQNAQKQKWTSLVGAAVKFVDATTHAVAGNALYRRLILDVCDYVENANTPCKYRGKKVGYSPWNKALELFACECESLKQKTCIAYPMSVNDERRAVPDNVAICSSCGFNVK